MTEKLLGELQELYPFTPCQAPEFDAFELNGMAFTTRGYEAEGLGRVSLMEASGMGGAMTMTALIVNPVDIDAPLFNLDLITLPGKHSHTSFSRMTLPVPDENQTSSKS